MGSTQSSQSATLPGSLPNETIHDEKELSKKQPPSHLSGVALVEYKCRKKKKAWSKCVNMQHNLFLEGKKPLEPEEDCDDLFESFRQCYMRGMLKERQKRGLDTPKEGTMLAEFIDEEGLEPKTK